MADAFSLKLQRNNRKNALARNSAKGKAGEKAVCPPCRGDETTTCHDRAFLFHYTSLKFTVILSFKQVILIFDNQAEAMYFLKAVIPFYFLNWLCYRKWLMFFPCL